MRMRTYVPVYSREHAPQAWRTHLAMVARSASGMLDAMRSTINAALVTSTTVARSSSGISCFAMAARRELGRGAELGLGLPTWPPEVGRGAASSASCAATSPPSVSVAC